MTFPLMIDTYAYGYDPPSITGRDEPAMEESAEQGLTGPESAERGNTKQGNAEGDTLDECAEEESASAIATTTDWTSTPLDPPMEGSESLTLELQGFRDWKLQKLPRQYFSYKRKLVTGNDGKKVKNSGKIHLPGKEFQLVREQVDNCQK